MNKRWEVKDERGEETGKGRGRVEREREREEKGESGGKGVSHWRAIVVCKEWVRW